MTSDATDPVPGNNSESADAAVISVVKLAVLISRTPANPEAGGEMTYTVTVDNTDDDVEGLTVTDELPAGNTSSASRGRLIVCRVSPSGSVCTVRYDGKGRPKVTGALRRGAHTYVSGNTRSGRLLRLNSRRRIGEGKYTLVRTYNGRRITFDAVCVVVVR